MAEVRKVSPGSGSIFAAAIEKAIGANARPVAPGGSPDPTKSTPVPVPSAAETPLTASSFLLNEDFVVYADDSEAEYDT